MRYLIILLVLCAMTFTQAQEVNYGKDTRVKVIKTIGDTGQLERDINKFLASIPDYRIIDIEYQIAVVGIRYESQKIYSVIIIYRKE